jgi:hypothetical protein
MGRIVHYVEDRVEDFDGYMSCDKKHAEMLLSSIGSMLNETCE